MSKLHANIAGIDRQRADYEDMETRDIRVNERDADRAAEIVKLWHRMNRSTGEERERCQARIINHGHALAAIIDHLWEHET